MKFTVFFPLELFISQVAGNAEARRIVDDETVSWPTPKTNTRNR